MSQPINRIVFAFFLVLHHRPAFDQREAETRLERGMMLRVDRGRGAIAHAVRALLRREVIRRARRGRLRARDLRAALNPAPQQLDFLRRQLFVFALRHLAIADQGE